MRTLFALFTLIIGRGLGWIPFHSCPRGKKDITGTCTLRTRLRAAGMVRYLGYQILAFGRDSCKSGLDSIG
jgi:hypothetical protein